MVLGTPLYQLEQEFNDFEKKLSKLN